MIRYLRNNEIDKALWDRCISSSPDGIVYAESWYLDIVSHGWDALVKDNYESVFPLTWRKKWNIHYLFQPYFTQQLGLFSINNTATENLVREFTEAIPEKFRLIEIQLNTGNKIDKLEHFRTNERVTHHLDLTANYESLKKKYSENLSRNIRRSKNSGLSLDQQSGFSEIIDLFRLNKGKEVFNLGNSDYNTFRKLLAAATDRGNADIRYANDSEGKRIAGAIFLASKSSYIFIFSANTPDGKDSGAMAFLIDSFIRDHAGERKILDFEGSMDKNLSRFYKSFGSQEIVYLQILKNKLPFIIRWLK